MLQFCVAADVVSEVALAETGQMLLDNISDVVKASSLMPFDGQEVKRVTSDIKAAIAKLKKNRQ